MFLLTAFVWKYFFRKNLLPIHDKCWGFGGGFLFFVFFYLNILDLLIISNAMFFFLNFYENFQIFKMFKFLFLNGVK